LLSVTRDGTIATSEILKGNRPVFAKLLHTVVD
jgi:hypothetical protein